MKLEEALYILRNTAWLGGENSNVELALYTIEIYINGINDCCMDCAFNSNEEWEMPCKKCRRNCKDYYRYKEDEK